MLSPKAFGESGVRRPGLILILPPFDESDLTSNSYHTHIATRKQMLNTVTREIGLNGLPKIVLHHKSSGASADVYLWGATLTSYKTSPEREMLFVSKEAVFDGKKAIRGGVPLVFPQFGQPKKEMSQHGFARTSTWDVTEMLADDEVVRVREGNGQNISLFLAPLHVIKMSPSQAVLHLSDSAATRALWPFPFLLSYTLSLTAKALTTTLRIHNTGTKPFEAQALLHTYLRVRDITKVGVHGFHGSHYIDKVDSSVDLPIDKRDEATIEKVGASEIFYRYQ